jgi:hypothetical protein
METIKNVYIFKPKKGRKAKPFFLSFSLGKAIPRLVASQQGQSPFYFTKQRKRLNYFIKTELLTIKLKIQT